jgi:pimeloyl-ACP methyl ester carboxylesterase
VRGEFVDLGGTRLYYYAAGTRGAGAPVVFLHGLATSGHLWSEVASLMPPGHRLVVVDLLGHGRSDAGPDAALTLAAHADRVVALLDALGIVTACIVGHGVGGGIAQAMAVAHSARVSHLALIASIDDDAWPRRELLLARLALPLLRRLPPAWLLSVVRGELERGYVDRQRAAHALDRFGRPFATVAGRNVLGRQLLELCRHRTGSLASRLGTIVAPTAVVCGDADPFSSPSVGRRLADAIPQATFAIVSEARHFLPEESPRQVADAVAALLRRA